MPSLTNHIVFALKKPMLLHELQYDILQFIVLEQEY